MRTESEVRAIVARLRERLGVLFPNEQFEIVLFGSYARRDADEDSDIDVLVLVDTSRQEILQRNWEIGEIASDLLLDCGILISPIVENREYYRRNLDLLPLYRNIQREGVRLGA